MTAHASEQGASALAQATGAIHQGQFDQAVALLEPWTADPAVQQQALQLMGVAFARSGRLDQALACQQRALALAPGDLAAWINLASTQTALGDTAAAQQSLARALELDPAQPAIHFNRGNLLMQSGDLAAACESFARAAELAPERPDPLCNQAVALSRLGRHGEAVNLLHGVVTRHPRLVAGWRLLAEAWQALEKASGVDESLRRGEPVDARFIEGNAFIATGIMGLGLYAAAKPFAQRGVQLAPDDPALIAMLGLVLFNLKEFEQARQWLSDVRRRDPQHPVVLDALLHQSTIFCDWDGIEHDVSALRRSVAAGHPVRGLGAWRLLSLPFAPAELRSLTEKIFADVDGSVAEPSQQAWRRHVGAARPQRLRIAYLSADFFQHATAVLMAGMFEQHDKTRFETIAICYSPSVQKLDGPMRQRLRATFDRFEVVEQMDDAAVARLMRDMDVHIAVDLKGHTLGQRAGILARRGAPVQMHYLGYPGTLGMPQAVDYLVADRVIVPPESRAFYSEKIIELPDSYQVNDRARPIDAHPFSRAQCGLPADGLVFCCFNANYKITREVFAVWMALLRQRPGSSLWLYRGAGAADAQLQAAAASAGVDPGRLVFADHAIPPLHLARHALADLFLDTWPCNAHTTGSDALWAGLPLLTCTGDTFASRVGASLLQACGLPQLIATDPQSYLDKALALSADPQILKGLREQLLATRFDVPLFDTVRFTRHLEDAYDMAWERLQRGLPPEHLTVRTRV